MRKIVSRPISLKFRSSKSMESMLLILPNSKAVAFVPLPALLWPPRKNLPISRESTRPKLIKFLKPPKSYKTMGL